MRKNSSTTVYNTLWNLGRRICMLSALPMDLERLRPMFAIWTADQGLRTFVFDPVCHQIARTLSSIRVFYTKVYYALGTVLLVYTIGPIDGPIFKLVPWESRSTDTSHLTAKKNFLKQLVKVVLKEHKFVLIKRVLIRLLVTLFSLFFAD